MASRTTVTSDMGPSPSKTLAAPTAHEWGRLAGESRRRNHFGPRPPVHAGGFSAPQGFHAVWRRREDKPTRLGEADPKSPARGAGRPRSSRTGDDTSTQPFG